MESTEYLNEKEVKMLIEKSEMCNEELKCDMVDGNTVIDVEVVAHLIAALSMRI